MARLLLMVLCNHRGDRCGQDQGTGRHGRDGIELMGMEGHFGADVVLDKKGPYVVTVGTQLDDGVKRQFVIKYELK